MRAPMLNVRGRRKYIFKTKMLSRLLNEAEARGQNMESMYRGLGT